MSKEISLLHLDAIMKTYRSQIRDKVKWVYIFGDATEREPEKVFVELSIVQEYQPPTLRTNYYAFEPDNPNPLLPFP